MIIDSSALCAIALTEVGFEEYLDAVTEASAVFMSAVSFLESSISLEVKRPGHGAAQIRALIDELGIRVTPFTEEEAAKAIEGFRRYGKGRHPAGLNFGDCATYGSSKIQGRRLLFKGDDFAKTDVENVLS